MKCILCRDEGTTEGCPKCGKIYNPLQNNNSKVSNSDMDKLNIPEYYRKLEWEKETLLRNTENVSQTFINYANNLEKVFENIKKGNKLRSSILISSPSGYGKTTWAMCLQKEYLKLTDNLVPILETAQACAMLKEFQEKGRKSYWLNVSIERYIKSDVLFLNVSSEYAFAFEVIVDMLNMRSRLDKPTIILSNFGIKNLLSADRKELLTTLLSAKQKVDPLRYPVIIKAY